MPVIENIDVLKSDDLSDKKENKNKITSSDDNELCLEIHTVTSLTSRGSESWDPDEDIDVFEFHDIQMKIPVPKCQNTANTPCSILISELIHLKKA